MSDTNLHLLSAKDLIELYAAELQLDSQVTEKAVELWAKFNCADESKYVAKKFQAAAAIYLAGLLYNLMRTQKEIATVAGCSSGALNLACKKMKRELWQ